MKKAKFIIVLLSVFLITGCTQNAKKQPTNSEKKGDTQNVVGKIKNELSECEKAGGKLQKMTECDGSENDYCILSEKIHCYADLVKNGKCDVEFSEKRYNETGYGMVGPGSGPRVLCDGGEFGQ